MATPNCDPTCVVCEYEGCADCDDCHTTAELPPCQACTDGGEDPASEAYSIGFAIHACQAGACNNVGQPIDYSLNARGHQAPMHWLCVNEIADELGIELPIPS